MGGKLWATALEIVKLKSVVARTLRGCHENPRSQAFLLTRARTARQRSDTSDELLSIWHDAKTDAKLAFSFIFGVFRKHEAKCKREKRFA